MLPRRTSHQSKRFTFKRRTRAFLFASGIIASLALSIYVTSAFSALDALAVNIIRITGVDTESEQVVARAAAAEALTGKYFGLFSRANSLIYPEKAIEAKIKSQLSSAEDVSVDREGVHGLNIVVTEKKPAALICTTLPEFNGTDLSLDDPGSCYFADHEGRLFEKAPSFSGNVYHRYYLPELGSEASSSEVLIGQYASTTAEFATLEKVYSIVSEQGIVTDAILMKPNREYELYARNPVFGSVSSSTASTVVVYFNTASSVDDQTTNLVSFWKHMVDEARSKRQTIQFDSIDVRYGTNVFYRESK